MTPTLLTPKGRIYLPAAKIADTDAAIRAELLKWNRPLVLEMLRGATCVCRWRYVPDQQEVV